MRYNGNKELYECIHVEGRVVELEYGVRIVAHTGREKARVIKILASCAAGTDEEAIGSSLEPHTANRHLVALRHEERTVVVPATHLRLASSHNNWHLSIDERSM